MLQFERISDVFFLVSLHVSGFHQSLLAMNQPRSWANTLKSLRRLRRSSLSSIATRRSLFFFSCFIGCSCFLTGLRFKKRLFVGKNHTTAVFGFIDSLRRLKRDTIRGTDSFRPRGTDMARWFPLGFLRLLCTCFVLLTRLAATASAFIYHCDHCSDHCSSLHLFAGSF